MYCNYIYYPNQLKSKIGFILKKRNSVFNKRLIKTYCYMKCGGEFKNNAFRWCCKRESMKDDFDKTLKFKHINRELKELIYIAGRND